MTIWTKLHRWVNAAAARFCRHREGTVCGHNAYDHDLRYHGYNLGYHAGEHHERIEWETASPELRDTWLRHAEGRGVHR